MRLHFEGMPNIRDLGGLMGADGRAIRPGMLIRSGNLCDAKGGDLARLAELIDTAVDFRTPKEREEKPDPPIDGVTNIHLPVIRTISAGVTREQKTDEQVFAQLAADAEAARHHMRCAYIEFVEEPEARRQYARFVRLLLEEHPRAVLWHCTAGKDRAGFATVIVEKRLGVSDADILADYLMTNTCMKESYGQLIATLRQLMRMPEAAQPGADAGMWAMFSADETYLQAAYDTADRLFGSFDGFLREGLGITQEERARLRERYLEA